MIVTSIGFGDRGSKGHDETLNHGMGSFEKAPFCESPMGVHYHLGFAGEMKRHQFKLKTPPNFSIQVRALKLKVDA